MARIQRLSQNLINKIAAGEVIERPASVVKELMENSLDAGASRIDVAIEKGGSDLIRITDDGCGMDLEDLELAITSHATSKLQKEDDLFHVSTMGFRGEAMASVAEISHLTIRSRVNPEVKPKVGEAAHSTSAEAVSGAEIHVEGGRYEPPQPCGTPAGTCIEVKHLFFNTPVRRKFLKSVSTEFGHITEVFSRLALANPKVHFTLKHNGRTVLDLPATDDWLQRIRGVVGNELADGLLYVEKKFSQCQLRGYVARPTHSRSSQKMQYLFLNGRPIRDKSLQHALSEAYRGLLTVGRYPVCFLELDMPAGLVDVNVHPTKMEVRFQDSGIVYSQLLSTLREKFLTTNLSTFVGTDRAEPNLEKPNLEPPGVAQSDAGTSQEPSEPLPVKSLPAEPWRQTSLEWKPAEKTSAEPFPGSVPPFRPFGGGGLPRVGAVARSEKFAPLPAASLPASEPKRVSEPRMLNTLPPRAVQIHNRYLATQCSEGLMVVDQHAMHERILFERLKKRVASASVEVQELLVPEPVDLSPSDASILLEHRDVLRGVGILLESFGGSTVLVHGLPAVLFTFTKKRPAVDELLQEILEHLKSGGKLSLETFTDDVLHTIACKAAVKAGQSLSPEEINRLLDAYQECSQADHCPHGRPAVLIWSCQELDKLFCRIL
ncbi:MAG: DNA mismatch repair endonuclease MutL [Planctomycetia bacterium]|nr:DNA mismatch repair endonuclease MutL [Planctomycetia bacterium]